MLDVIKNITRTDISIVNFWMFQNYLSPGYLSLLDFIKLMPHENHICTTEIKGKDIKQMIKAVQKGQRGFQPTSGLKQFVKINNITKEKEVVDIKLYNKENELVQIEDEKIYTLSSNNFVLSEYCENEFAEKDSLDIIKAKKREGKIKCSKVNTYIEIMYYFKNKGIIDINKDIDITKKRIVFVN
jgi:2',3'-cyclic-nucleotide 2'-phosphodiesterase (5'-nucleotidase family)